MMIAWVSVVDKIARLLRVVVEAWLFFSIHLCGSKDQ
jgi:hypothetical protein